MAKKTSKKKNSTTDAEKAKSANKKSSTKKTTKSSRATASKTKAKPTKPASGKSASKKAPSKSKSSAKTYDKPELREKIKDKVMQGTKGGKKGQWSARKAQLVAHDYEEAGGGYRGKKTAKQKHLSKWTDEDWHTKDGKKAQQGDTTARYLPDKAWDELSEAQKKATDAKKKKASRDGKQYVKNTTTAKRAGKKARTTKKTAGKK